jgi:uncharacterized protein YbjQ (UPF0145 family)
MGLEILVGIVFSIGLLVVGRIVGASIEKKHFADIAEREAYFRNQPALSVKQGEAPYPIRSASLASGSVVVSIDHFKRFVSAFRMLVGGEVRSYASLIDRARREAILRMKESQPNADAYLNTRLETSTIASTQGDEGLGTIEVLAYATAVHYDSPP